MFVSDERIFPVGPYSINRDGNLYFEGKPLKVFGSYMFDVNAISFVDEIIENEVKHYVVIDATACFGKIFHEKIVFEKKSSFFRFLEWEDYKKELHEWVCHEKTYIKWVKKNEQVEMFSKRYVN